MVDRLHDGWLRFTFATLAPHLPWRPCILQQLQSGGRPARLLQIGLAAVGVSVYSQADKSLFGCHGT